LAIFVNASKPPNPVLSPANNVIKNAVSMVIRVLLN
jgi:hypothetical protein